MLYYIIDSSHKVRLKWAIGKTSDQCKTCFSSCHLLCSIDSWLKTIRNVKKKPTE
uniref:Uncharacterized protein n=1 Tax=Anguilla anguilla TaxID=7936 RepID=A0A0E9W9S2_ANGAN